MTNDNTLDVRLFECSLMTVGSLKQLHFNNDVLSKSWGSQMFLINNLSTC